MSLRAQAANTDYSNQTLDHGIDVIGAGISISGDNLTITGSSLVSSSNRNEGIYIGAGSTGHFGGDKLEVKFTASDTTHEFAGIQVNGQTTGDASAVFDAAETIIDVSGPVSSGKWGFGLLVNGLGTNTASATFTGGNVSVKTTTETYTSQSVTVKANASLDFSNSGDVTVEAYSPFGITVVDAYGDLKFNNSGNVLLTGKILPGTHTGQTNVVGIQGTGSWTVTSNVKELRIALTGAGVDNDGTSYSTGTKGIDFSGDGASFDVQSERFIISMGIGSDVTDDSPEGHTASQAYGINIDSKAKLAIGSSTKTHIVVNQGLGTAYGINAGSGAEVTFAGDTTIKANGSEESIAVRVDGTNISTSVTFSGANNSLEKYD